MTESNVFLSHKRADARIASRIHAFISVLTAGSVDVFNFSSYRKGLKPGSNIQAELANKLRAAEVVALVFSRTDEDWSYCMWECGVALGASHKNDKVIIVLQCLAGTKPSVFEGQRLVQLWDLEDVKSFARMFKEKDLFPSLRGPATRLEDDLLEKLAVDLHEDLSPLLEQSGGTAERRPLHPTVHIKTSTPDPESLESEPELATFRSDEWSSRELFGWAVTEGTLQSIPSRLRNRNHKLLEELVGRARDFRETKEPPAPLTKPFIGSRDVIYNPVLTAMTELGDQSVEYDLVFIRWDGDYDRPIPDDMAAMFAARPVYDGMEPFNTRVPLLKAWRMTWYAGSEVLVSDIAEFYLSKSANRYRGRATVTHRFPWDMHMHSYAIEGQASSTGEFIFTYWNLFGANLLGSCVLKKATSGIYTGEWIGSSGTSDASDARMMRGRLRMCTHTGLLEELRQARKGLKPGETNRTIDTLTAKTLEECEECVRIQGSLLDDS